MNSLSPKSGFSYICRTNPSGQTGGPGWADEITESLEPIQFFGRAQPILSRQRVGACLFIAEMVAGAEIWAELFGTNKNCSNYALIRRDLSGADDVIPWR
jgi:hypothetical protein